MKWFRDADRKSFTLVEMIVVTAVVSVFGLFLFRIYKAALDTWTKTEANLKVFQNARIALDQLSRELKSAIVDPVAGAHFYGYNGPTTTRSNTPIRSVEDEVFFVGLLNPASADSEICEVGYWLDGNSTGTTADDVLRRFYLTDGAASGFDYDFTTPTNLTNDDQMCRRVTDFQLEYWDDVSGTPAWVDTWDSSTGAQAGFLPKSVRMTVTASDEFGRQTKSFTTIVSLR